jgi:tetratricopeptide (TPR) repeat protein
MKPEESKIPSSKYFKLFAILAVSFMAIAGLMSSLGGFFTWINLLFAAFFFLLAYKQLPPEPRGNEQREEANYSATNQRTTPSSISPPPDRSVIVVASLFVSGLLFLIAFIAIFVTDPAIDFQVLSEQAENHRLNGDYDSAIYYYRQAIRSDENNSDALLGCGNSHLGKQNYDSADFYYDKVLEIDPYNVYASYNKSLVKYNQEYYDQAIASGWKTVDLAPEYYDTYALLGDSYYATTNYDSALYYYTIAYENNIRSAWLSHVMGYLHDLKGHTAEAIALYEEAVSYDSTKTDVYQRLGELLPGDDGRDYREKALQTQ